MSIYDVYTDFIKKTQLTIPPENWYFKCNPKFTYMLEHVNHKTGYACLNILTTKFKSFFENNLQFLVDLCSLNDKFGKTTKKKFENFTTCSPTNVRYILHSLIIIEFIKKKNLQDLNIIEIGGGYGGLCLFLTKIAEKFNIKINSYCIFDLINASSLQKLYLDALNIKNIDFYQLDNFGKIYENSFLVSTYAFSEIPMSIQEEYTKKIINPFTKFGWIAWNNIPLYDFVENSLIEKEREYPYTANTEYNYFVKFYPKK